MQSIAPPLPPPGRWLRLATAAAVIGVSPKMLKGTIRSGRAAIRTQVLGASGLVHVAEVDVAEYARQLHTGATR